MSKSEARVRARGEFGRVLNSLVLKPLPVAGPDRIYFVDNSGHSTNSFPNYRAIRDRHPAGEIAHEYSRPCYQ
jgi:hypothetical protein